jgi:uncharacterized protein YbaP (TraB family)
MGPVVRLIAIAALLFARHGWAAPDAGCPPEIEPFTPELFTKAQSQASDRGLLWAITKDDRVSYLYGTLHLGRAEWMAPGPAVRQALRQADVLALELDPLDADIQRELAAGAARVKRKLSARSQQRLDAAFKALCPAPQNLAALETQPPELQVVSLMLLLGTRDGISPAYGSEILLSLIARELHRPVISLETPALQLQALLAKDDVEAEGFVKETLDDLEQGKVRRVLTRTAQVWERGDIAQLEHYLQWCECSDTDSERKLMKRVLDDRNPGLAEGIDQLHMKGGAVFAAVGAMHMVGPSGLPALLAKRGFRVDRLH